MLLVRGQAYMSVDCKSFMCGKCFFHFHFYIYPTDSSRCAEPSPKRTVPNHTEHTETVRESLGHTGHLQEM